MIMHPSPVTFKGLKVAGASDPGGSDATGCGTTRVSDLKQRKLRNPLETGTSVESEPE